MDPRALGVRTLLAIALAWIAGAVHAQPPATTPDALIRSSFEEAKAIVRQTTDPKKLRQIAEQRFLPYFDFKQMTRLAVGPGWRRATPEQQQQLSDAFRALLIHT